jgi:hypothetical protein
MASECGFCGIRRYVETKMMVLGQMWVEFCDHCAERNVLHNAEDGQTYLVREVWDKIQTEQTGGTFVRNPQDVTLAAGIAQAEEEAARDAFAWDGYWELRQAAEQNHWALTPAEGFEYQPRIRCHSRREMPCGNTRNRARVRRIMKRSNRPD